MPSFERRVMKMDKDRRIFDRFEVEFSCEIKEPKKDHSHYAQC